MKYSFEHVEQRRHILEVSDKELRQLRLALLGRHDKVLKTESMSKGQTLRLIDHMLKALYSDRVGRIEEE